MTIAAGFVCLDGIVLCADTQETIPGYTKNSRNKIRVWKDQGLGIAIVGSGDAESIETLGQLIEKDLTGDYSPKEMRFPCDLRQIIEKTVLEFFQKSIVPYASFPRDDRPYVDLLIGIQVLNEVNNYQCLFKAAGTTVREIEADANCIGTGLILAKSLIERLYSPFMGLDELVIVACYVLYHAKKWTDGCGGNTDLLIASYANDFFGGVRSADVKMLETIFEEVDEWVKELIVGLPNSNVSQVEFRSLVRHVQERMLETRKHAFKSGNDLFDVLKKLKARPSASQKSEPEP